MRSLFSLLLSILFMGVAFPLHAQYLQQTEHLEITRERTFEGPALYGFMNGGSELFLEYGFLHLMEQQIIFQGVPFVVEYYLMDSPQNAYGIYSVHTFKCRRADERFPVECLTPGLLQLYLANYYITLKCLERGNDAYPLLDAIAEIVTDSLNEQSTNPPSFPPPYSGYLYYICGDLGLSSAYINWASTFLPYTQFAMWLRIDSETQKPSAEVRFASSEDLESFVAANNGRFQIIKVSEDTLFVAE